mmetsp:Transcript_3643/g.12773  ORF Transcript_3643/g.12773 Transcript_3643/m.12773 type:complete len:146 (+) Transcript_3643:112-549(+)
MYSAKGRARGEPVGKRRQKKSSAVLKKRTTTGSPVTSLDRILKQCAGSQAKLVEGFASRLQSEIVRSHKEDIKKYRAKSEKRRQKLGDQANETLSVCFAEKENQRKAATQSMVAKGQDLKGKFRKISGKSNQLIKRLTAELVRMD